MRTEKINSRDISFVVQGNICGTESEPSIYTRRLCESIRTYFSEAELIVSTWEDQDTTLISADRVIKSGLINAGYIVRPDGRIYLHTLNHQLVTSRAGLKLASRKYAVKVRSDLIFENDSLLEYFEKYNCYHQDEYKISRQRMIVLPTYDYRRGMCWPYNVCDWIYAGLQSDLLDVFDIPLQDYDTLKRRADGMPWVEDNLGAEQYIWIEYLKKGGVFPRISYATDPNLEEQQKFEKTIAQNLVLLPANKMGITNQKAPRSGYVARPWLSQGLYTFNDWKQIYNQYSNGDAKIRCGLIEKMAYEVALETRRRLASCNTGLYDEIVRMVRKYRGEYK